jgi:hypothetical protein
LTTNSCILENEVIQRRLGFHFIMHLYHWNIEHSLSLKHVKHKT